VEHQPFSAKIPLPCNVNENGDSADQDENDGDATYMRDNIEGFWFDQNDVLAEE
jgi:hypothetical protein